MLYLEEKPHLAGGAETAYLWGMQQIELEPREFRRGPTRQHPLTHRVFLRAAVVAAVWFVLVVSYGRLFSPPIAWYLVALIAFAPGLMLGYIAISLDD